MWIKAAQGPALQVSGSTISALGQVPAGEKFLSFERMTAGLFESHVHPLSLGVALSTLDLNGLNSPEAVADKVALNLSSDWTMGMGYLFEGYPSSELLDRVAPEQPVYLLSRDLHAAWVNQAALRRAGIDRSAPDPPGGFILRDLKGEPTGYLLENAIGLVEQVVPPPTKNHLKAGYQALAKLGFTACASMAADPGPALSWSEELSRDGELPLRVFFSLGREDFRTVKPGWRGEDLEVAAVKFFADGALGSRTAWSLEPYPDGSFGTPVDPPELIREEGEAALRAGYTLAVHAIGSRASASVAGIFAELAPLALRPLRLEHAQHLTDATIRILQGLPVVASLQPVHLEADQDLLRDLPPHFSQTAFRMASLLRAGIAIALGSDAPVAQALVTSGLAMACAQPVLPAESLSTKQALYGYTTGGAVAAGWPDYGQIKVGARADLTLWEGDSPIARVFKGELETF